MGFSVIDEQSLRHPSEQKTAYPRRDFVESGLRLYSSVIGRWLSRDPIEEVGFRACYQQYGRIRSRGIYNFLKNRPVGGVDMLGLIECSWDDGCMPGDKKQEISNPSHEGGEFTGEGYPLERRPDPVWTIRGKVKDLFIDCYCERENFNVFGDVQHFECIEVLAMEHDTCGEFVCGTKIVGSWKKKRFEPHVLLNTVTIGWTLVETSGPFSYGRITGIEDVGVVWYAIKDAKRRCKQKCRNLAITP